MNNDYQDFLQSDHQSPKELDAKIKNSIHEKMNPSHKLVFMKLISIQGFIGFVTMLFCPQFNFSLTNNYDLFHYFHIVNYLLIPIKTNHTLIEYY